MLRQTQSLLRQRIPILILTVAVPLAGLASPAGAAIGRGTYTGVIDGASYRIELPARWNGTLVLYSHGYYLPQFRPEGVTLATRPETEAWLLEHGYAVAASDYRGGGVGFAVKYALTDQIRLLDWFTEHIRRPRRTISSGISMGGGIAAMLAERNPHRFAGVLTQCAEFDLNGTWNIALDINFAVKTLLAPGQDIELVRMADATASMRALAAAIERAQETTEGRARIALAGAIGSIPGWASAFEPEPTDLEERLRQQRLWVYYAYTFGIGPTGRADMEARAGGNPSWNVGIDYRRQLAHSAQNELVRATYTAAGLDLDDDLARLATAPRIAPDVSALAHMYRDAVARGTTPAPVLTLHTTHDGGVVAEQERWYAEQVSRHGSPERLRQIYSARGNHCAFNAADEIVSLQALMRRVETGQWTDLTSDALNAAARDLGPGYSKVLDLMVDQERDVSPAFADFTPGSFLRPSR